MTNGRHGTARSCRILSSTLLVHWQNFQTAWCVAELIGRVVMLQEKKAKEMEELAATLAELGIQNVAPGQEDAAQTESSKRKKKKEKGKGADKDAKPEDATTEANGVPESQEEQPAAAAVAAESTPEASGEPEELVDPKEVCFFRASLLVCVCSCGWVLQVIR